MLTVQSNIGEVTGRLSSRVQSLMDMNGLLQDKLLRTLATTILADMRYRIHVEGKDSEGGQLGTYSNAYLKIRQRKPYNRNSDPKVILSLTRQMENDFSVVAKQTKSGYGLGFKNSVNFEKATWLQKRYGRFYRLDANQLKLLRDTTDQFIKDLNNDALS